MSARSYNVNDLLFFNNKTWIITGIYPGSAFQQDLICVTLADGRVLGRVEGDVVEIMHIPEEILNVAITSGKIIQYRKME